MSAIDTFVKLVLSDATVTTEVGTRMYASLMPPEPTTPAITYFVVANSPHNDTCGDLYTMTRIQTNIYATTLDKVIEIFAAMVALLHRYTGTYNSQDIVSIIMDFGMTTYESKTRIYRYINDWKMTTKGV